MKKVFLVSLLLIFLLGCTSAGESTKPVTNKLDNSNGLDIEQKPAPQIGPGATLCGNYQLDTGEQCDDGNRQNEDGCNSQCKEEYCGDGIKNDNNSEECDGTDIGIYGNGVDKCAIFNDQWYEAGNLSCFSANDVQGRGCKINTTVCTGPIRADFTVYDQVSAQPELWRKISSQEDLELGRQYRFDASTSVSPNDLFSLFSWSFGEGTFSTQTTLEHAFSNDGLYNVTLSVFDTDWHPNEKNQELNVLPGIEFLSEMPTPPQGSLAEMFIALEKTFVYENNYAWSIAQTGGRIGAVDISNPNDLPTFDIVLPNFVEPESDPQLEGSNGKLYLKINFLDQQGNIISSSIKIYEANPNNIQLYSELTSSQLGVSSITDISAINNLLYISTKSPNKLLVYDFSNPTAPQLRNSLTMAYSINNLSKASQVLLFNYSGAISGIDIRDPINPQLITDTIIGHNLTIANGKQAAGFIPFTDKLFFLKINAPENLQQPITFGTPTKIVIPNYESEAEYWITGVDQERLYLTKRKDTAFSFEETEITKISTLDPNNTYVYETINLGEEPDGHYQFNWLIDIDGPTGEQKPFIFQSNRDIGFSAYSS